MMQTIIKTEWRNLLAEKSFPVLATVFATLLIYGIYNGSGWIRERETQSRSLLEAQEKYFRENIEKIKTGWKPSPENPFAPKPDDPYSIGMSLQYAVLPFTSAAFFSLGQADVLDSNAGVTVSTLQRTQADKEGFENPLSFLVGRFDLSFVIVYLLPLFVLAISFNLLSAERENGSLQMLLANPLNLKNLLTAKLTAQFILIFAIVLTVTLIGSFFVTNITAGDFWLRASLWVILVFAYTLFWFSLAVFVNSLGYSSAANAVISSALWLILVLILPSLLNVAISSVYPVPSRNETISAIRSINLDVRRDGEKLLTEFYQDHPEYMPRGELDLKDFGLRFVYIQREQKKRVEEVENRFAEQLGKQQNLVRTFRFLSPSIITQEALNDIAGTGLERYAHFRSQVKEFDREWSNYFVPKIFRKEKLGVEDFDQIPRFKYAEEPFGNVFNRMILGVLFLFVASAVLLFAAFGKLKNYRLE